MEISGLQAERRDASGTRSARRLRREGKLPAVIYGHGQEPQNVAISAHDFGGLLDGGAHVLELQMGGGKQQVLIKDVQYDYLGSNPVHVDFTLVDLTEKVQVSVPLEFKGTPVGTHEGGVLDHSMVDLEVECLVTDIPESIRVNTSDMKLGDSMHVHELELPAGLTAVSPAESIICSVRAKTVAAEVQAEEEGEEGAEEGPEIIGRKEKEEGGEKSDSNE